mmetsp:Transcript_6726/g.7718  ORF Transcript_6726/g.7718 Transcript_6726/m.7718 type:complete len:147 (+) Transcript_6726:272-712(+)|eukprot:CAMPEP_0197845148 /NCGR_PEP_ID=MMETSP1438-20131217/2097_1 /TAXON_ID=1461541 /ORGANISM="Pterosperma sp., Strain CCMP1384" /LENGTH=146 /DNA_ID=CAMNT_0043456291 /DNA_START=260 /DNA_END=700 /DNA_ORIENTATION=+
MANWKSQPNYHLGVTGDNLRDPCPGYVFDVLTGEKKQVPVKKEKGTFQGCNDHAVSLPIGVSGLGVSEPVSGAKVGPSTISNRIYRENMTLHVRSKLENRDKFAGPATSAQVVGFHEQKSNLPAYGRKCCPETLIEDNQILGARHP